MKTLLKLTILCAFSSSLTGCAFTQGIVQNAYDERAEKECRPMSGGADSIHQSAKSNCVNGLYDPEPKTKQPKPKRE